MVAKLDISPQALETKQVASLSEPEDSRKTSGPRLPWRSRLALFIFGCIVAILIVEIGFRTFTPGRHVAHQRTDRPEYFYFDAESTTNRDYNYSIKKPENTWRMIVLGDSFTFGVGLQFNDTFPKRLETLLGLSSSSKRAEVLNFGVPGNSSTQELMAAHAALKFEPDLFLVQLTLNDPEKQPYRVTHPIDQHGHTRLESPLFSHWMSLAFLTTRVLDSWSRITYKQYYFDLFENRETWNDFSRNYDQLKALSEKHHVPLVVVIFPLFSHNLDKSYPFLEIHKKIRNMLNEKQIIYLDLFNSFRGINPERLQLIPGVDSHPNEIAHRIASESIFNWIKQNRLAPVDLSKVPRSRKRRGNPRDLNRSIGLH